MSKFDELSFIKFYDLSVDVAMEKRSYVKHTLMPLPILFLSDKCPLRVTR